MTVSAAGRALLLVAVLVVAPAGGAGAQPALAPLFKSLDLVGYAAGVTPPDWSGPTPDGRPVSLSALRGQVVLINFWASWCLECRSEMPALEHLYRELSPRGFLVVGVNSREHVEVVRRYARELGVTFPLALDASGKITALYGVVGLPATFLVGRDGRAVAFGIGARDWAGARARTLFDALLTEPAPPRAAP